MDQYFKKYIGNVLMIAILVPVLTNLLMFINIFPVAGDEKTWIGYLGSYWGAIIGGLISGAITWLGVRYTINHTEKNRLIDEYPKKINNLELLIQSLDSILEEIEEYMYVEDPFESNNRKELRLFTINSNLDVVPLNQYNYLTTHFLNKIKEYIIGIDSKWYKDFYMLRETLNEYKLDFEYDTEDLKVLYEEATSYFLEHFEPLTDWKEYAETHESSRFTLACNRIASNEVELINKIYYLYSDFKINAEFYQIELMESIE